MTEDEICERLAEDAIANDPRASNIRLMMLTLNKYRVAHGKEPFDMGWKGADVPDPDLHRHPPTKRFLELMGGTLPAEATP